MGRDERSALNHKRSFFPKRRQAIRKFRAFLAIGMAFLLCSCGGILYNAEIGNVERIEESLENGISIETRNQAGSTPLIVAAYSNQPEAVEYLCKQGANVNAQNNNGVTALHHAAYHNLVEVAEVLLKYHPDKTIKDRYGNTPLDYAKMYDYDRMIELLKSGN